MGISVVDCGEKSLGEAGMGAIFVRVQVGKKKLGKRQEIIGS